MDWKDERIKRLQQLKELENDKKILLNHTYHQNGGYYDPQELKELDSKIDNIKFVIFNIDKLIKGED